jgi:anti-sigma B factor antagonist
MAAVVAHPLNGPDGIPPAFRCEIRPARRCAYVQPVGDLDMATVPELDTVLDQLHGDGFEELILDLRGVTFMDSSGLHLVLRWAAECPRLAVVRGNAQIERLFSVTAADETLRFVERPEVAAA